MSSCFFIDDFIPFCNFTDNEPPIITCPDDVRVSANPNANTRIVQWAPPLVSDNSGGFTVTSNISPGVELSTDETPVAVVYNVFDGSENTASCEFIVTVAGISFETLNINGILK